jgi:hypothetical protein
MIMWMTVQLEDGMFPNERAVSLRTSDGRTISLFVAATKVRQERDAGLLEVGLIDATDTDALIELPATSIDGLTVAKVNRSLLRAEK